MAYFQPYVDDSGIHLPTYEERLAYLSDEYRTIFGENAELSAAVPDYQLLSVFSKSLDDVSALALRSYNSRNPFYATGEKLDLLLPQYGITRAEGESDAAVRSRIKAHLFRQQTDPISRLRAGIRTCKANTNGLNQVYVNDTDTVDANGIPAHSAAVVLCTNTTSATWRNRLAQAIFDHKPPGMKLWADIPEGQPQTADPLKQTGTAVDADGNSHSIDYIKAGFVTMFIAVFISWQDSVDVAELAAAIRTGVGARLTDLGIGTPILVPPLYGMIYASAGGMADKFRVVDIQASRAGASSITRTVIPCAWDECLEMITPEYTINFYDQDGHHIDV